MVHVERKDRPGTPGGCGSEHVRKGEPSAALHRPPGRPGGDVPGTSWACRELSGLAQEQTGQAGRAAAVRVSALEVGV